MIQGITGTIGSLTAGLSLDCGTNLVAGVTPGKGGQTVLDIPVYNTVKEAADNHGANGSVIFAPARHAATAAHEALDAGVPLVVVITEHVPVKDALGIKAHAEEAGATVFGPNCPGLLSPGIGKMGFIPHHITHPGRIGIVSRSGTLSYEVAADLAAAGLGQSTIVGIGGDPVPCTGFVEVLAAFDADPETDAVVLVGEVGGVSEEVAARYVQESMKKPVFAYIAGLSAPPGRKMGHAGAIIRGSAGTAQSKIKVLEEAGVVVARQPSDLPRLVRERLGHVA